MEKVKCADANTGIQCSWTCEWTQKQSQTYRSKQIQDPETEEAGQEGLDTDRDILAGPDIDRDRQAGQDRDQDSKAGQERDRERNRQTHQDTY